MWSRADEGIAHRPVNTAPIPWLLPSTGTEGSFHPSFETTIQTPIIISYCILFKAMPVDSPFYALCHYFVGYPEDGWCDRMLKSHSLLNFHGVSYRYTKKCWICKYVNSQCPTVSCQKKIWRVLLKAKHTRNNNKLIFVIEILGKLGNPFYGEKSA